MLYLDDSLTWKTNHLFSIYFSSTKHECIQYNTLEEHQRILTDATLSKVSDWAS